MKQLLPHLFWFFGIFMVLLGIAIGFLTPEQDGSSLMTHRPVQHKMIFIIYEILGISLLLAGIAWLAARWVLNQKKLLDAILEQAAEQHVWALDRKNEIK